MSDRAPRSRAQDGVMACDMTADGADRGSLETTLGRRGRDETDRRQQEATEDN